VTRAQTCPPERKHALAPTASMLWLRPQACLDSDRKHAWTPTASMLGLSTNLVIRVQRRSRGEKLFATA